MVVLTGILVYPCHSNAHIEFNFMPIDARLAYQAWGAGVARGDKQRLGSNGRHGA